MSSLADLMHPAPRPWGLRGDPLLFDAMCKVFEDIPLPADTTALTQAFHSTFETLTGQPLSTAPDRIPVAWTRRTGGMSNGLVDRGYWLDKMLPALMQRHQQHAAT